MGKRKTITVSASPEPEPLQLTSLTDIVDSVEEKKLKDFEIDITRFLPSGKKAVILWRSPSMKRIYNIESDAATLRQQYMHWEPKMAVDVAAMAACHVVQEKDLSAGEFYARICEKNRDLWLFLTMKLNEVFPELNGVSNEGYFEMIFDFASEAYSKHPSQCGDLDSKVIAELVAWKKRKDARASSNL